MTVYRKVRAGLYDCLHEGENIGQVELRGRAWIALFPDGAEHTSDTRDFAYLNLKEPHIKELVLGEFRYLGSSVSFIQKGTKFIIDARGNVNVFETFKELDGAMSVFDMVCEAAIKNTCVRDVHAFMKQKS